MSDHVAQVTEYRVPAARTKAGRAKRYETRRLVSCSCGQPIGAGLDYIDAVRAWRKHAGPREGVA